MAPQRSTPDDSSKLVPQLQNNYQRPNYPWVCGNAAVGDPCWTGPTPQGKCGCRSECRPISRQGSWACSRPLHRGGTCMEGPTADGQCCRQRPPCVPRRSLLAQRSRLSFAAFCVCLGLGLIIYGSGKTYEVISPGPLSSPHAQHLAHQGTDRCAACHPAAHQSLGQWLSGLAGQPASNAGGSQTDLCLSCHQRDLCSDYALFAHNVDPQILAQHTSRATAADESSVTSLVSSLSSRLLNSSVATVGQPLACATCHQEHHGQQIDMKAMTDQQCQTCHAQTFHQFELDHPEFQQWPTVPAQGIRFDHRTHHFKHFPQANRTFECSQCHQDDSQGNVQKLVPFEQACGSCHQGQIDLSSQSGLALLQLPSFDLEAFDAAQEPVGQWPPILSSDFDGRLAPLSELLLMADPTAAAGLQVLGHDFDFLDLDTQDKAQMAAASQIAWGVKRLLADLSERGREAVRQRLQIVLDRPIDDLQLGRLTQNFSLTLFQDSARQWFPDLAQEVRREDFAPVSRFVAAAVADPSVASGRSPGTAGDVPRTKPLVIPDDILARLLVRTAAAQDRPQELLVENPLAAYRGGEAAPPAAQPSRPVQAPARATTPPRDDAMAEIPETTGTPRPATPRDAVGTAGAAAQAGAAKPRAFERPQHIDEPDLLARNPLADYGPGTGENPAAVAAGNPRDNAAAANASVESGSIGAAGEPSRPTVAAAEPSSSPPSRSVPSAADPRAAAVPGPSNPPVAHAPTAPQVPASPPLAEAAPGIGQHSQRQVGWVRDDARFAIQYHLVGHADPWLQAWIDLAIEQRGTAISPSPVVDFLVGAIAAPERAGNCLQCHGARDGDLITASVHWTSRYRDPLVKEWTKFNHRPHTLLPNLADCRSCHQMRETDGSEGTSGAGQGTVILAGFSRGTGGSAGADAGSGVGVVPVTPDSLQAATRRSDFHALTKSQCASCHHNGATRSSCTTCHNYHIGQQVPH